MPAVFDENGTRIKGVKSVKPAHYALDALLKFYRDKDIRKIDADALRDYKVARLTGTNKLSKVKLATVDRELSKLRKLFNVAVGKRWLISSPFTKEVSKELIQEGDETPWLRLTGKQTNRGPQLRKRSLQQLLCNLECRRSPLLYMNDGLSKHHGMNFALVQICGLKILTPASYLVRRNDTKQYLSTFQPSKQPYVLLRIIR